LTLAGEVSTYGGARFSLGDVKFNFVGGVSTSSGEVTIN
jgi:hypothetical protein